MRAPASSHPHPANGTASRRSTATWPPCSSALPHPQARQPSRSATGFVQASGGGVGGERVHTRTVPPATFTSAWSIANWHRATGAAGWHPLRRAVVFVDEVHGVSVDSPAAALIEDLHAQAAAPVLLICAGLSNSEKRLEQAGLSRIDHVVTLDCLSCEEAIECVETSLRQALERGVLGTDADAAPWAERITRASDGWPRHLHTYLRETWRVLREMEAPDLAQADIDRAMAEGDMARETYYRRRIEISGCPLPSSGRSMSASPATQPSASGMRARRFGTRCAKGRKTIGGNLRPFRHVGGGIPDGERAVVFGPSRRVAKVSRPPPFALTARRASPDRGCGNLAGGLAMSPVSMRPGTVPRRWFDPFPVEAARRNASGASDRGRMGRGAMRARWCGRRRPCGHSAWMPYFASRASVR